MEEYHNVIIHEMEARERFQITHQNNEIHSNVGILGIENGTGRKNILLKLIERDKMVWDDNPFIFSSYENIYNQGTIYRKNNFKCEKRKINVIVCHRYLIPSWVEILKENKVNYYLYQSNTLWEEIDSNIKIVLIRHSLAKHFLDKHFSRTALQRIILYNPQYFMLKKFTFLLYGFAWIILDNPKWILSCVQKHFVHNFVPMNIDYYIFNQLTIAGKFSSYPTHNFKKHIYKCQQEIFLILKDSISNELYDMLEDGNVEEVLQSFGSRLHCRNIYQHLLDDFRQKLDEIDLKLCKYQELNQNQKVLIMKTKKQSLLQKMESFQRRISNFNIDNQCIICRSPMKDMVLLCCCQNVTCGKCILQLVHLGQNCPYCRRKILNDTITMLDPQFYIQSNDTSTSINSSPRLMSRHEQIISILREAQASDTFLIYMKNLDTIKTIMTELGISNYKIFQGRYIEKKNQVEQLTSKKFNHLFVTDHLELLGFKFVFVDNFISLSPLKFQQEKFFLHKFDILNRDIPIQIHLFEF